MEESLKESLGKSLKKPQGRIHRRILRGLSGVSFERDPGEITESFRKPLVECLHKAREEPLRESLEIFIEGFLERTLKEPLEH